MTAPTQDECRALLESGGRWMLSGQWEIDSHLYTEADALALAELCLRFGQPLSAAITARMFLAVLRRLDAMEAALPALARRAGIPEREMPVWQDPERAERIRGAFAEAENGRGIDLGDFSHHLVDDETLHSREP